MVYFKSSPFNQIELNVNSDSYLKEFKEKINQYIIDNKCNHSVLTEDFIIAEVAKVMVDRNDNKIASDSDIEFFCKIMLVILNDNLGGYEYVKEKRIELKTKLHQRQVKIISESSNINNNIER